MKSTVGYVIYLLMPFAFPMIFLSPASATASERWRGDRACGITFSKPEQSIVAGCSEAYCISVSAAARVCSCAKWQESHNTQIRFEKNSAIVQQWDAAFFAPTSLADFRVERADLTGSGRDAIVVATMNAVSNGMGVEFWEVRAIVDNKLSNPVAVEDYGVMGYLTRGKSDKKCMLLATHWLEGWEPERGEGLYLMGRWFTYSKYAQELYPVIGRPAVYRRYLYSFQRLRLKELEKDCPQPLLWFSDREARELVGPYPKTWPTR